MSLVPVNQRGKIKLEGGLSNSFNRLGQHSSFGARLFSFPLVPHTFVYKEISCFFLIPVCFREKPWRRIAFSFINNHECLVEITFHHTDVKIRLCAREREDTIPWPGVIVPLFSMFWSGHVLA